MSGMTANGKFRGCAMLLPCCRQYIGDRDSSEDANDEEQSDLDVPGAISRHTGAAGNAIDMGDVRTNMDVFASRAFERWVAEPIGACCKCQNNIATAGRLCEECAQWEECWRALHNGMARTLWTAALLVLILSMPFLMFWLSTR